MSNEQRLPGFGAVIIGLIILALSLPPSTAGAESTTGRFQGGITDQTGAALPGVSVTVENVNTKATRITVSNESGNYDVPLLPPGTYNVAAELPGLRKDR